MSESNARKRNLPSWMSSREEKNDDGETAKQPRNHGKSRKDPDAVHGENRSQEKPATVGGSGPSDFSKIMDGIVFALSGFVNPERGILRSQMLEMGAEYQPDWNSNCTLLVCAFPNTPKFKQVKAEGGTIISQDWISECYKQRKLVDIETYLLHAGKPWRKHNILNGASEDIKPSSSSKSLKAEERSLPSKKTNVSPKMKGFFSPAKVKKWAIEDFKRTISWLESQEEKPQPGEIKNVAVEGILTCLQDTIDALNQGQGIQQISEQWACIPRLVEELQQFDDKNNGANSRSKEELCREAMVCKQIYELEFLNVEHDELVNSKRRHTNGSGKTGKGKGIVAKDDPSYDSDATIEMTEEEIDEAYNSIASSL